MLSNALDTARPGFNCKKDLDMNFKDGLISLKITFIPKLLIEEHNTAANSAAYLYLAFSNVCIKRIVKTIGPPLFACISIHAMYTCCSHRLW